MLFRSYLPEVPLLPYELMDDTNYNALAMLPLESDTTVTSSATPFFKNLNLKFERFYHFGKVKYSGIIPPNAESNGYPLWQGVYLEDDAVSAYSSWQLVYGLDFRNYPNLYRALKSNTLKVRASNEGGGSLSVRSIDRYMTYGRVNSWADFPLGNINPNAGDGLWQDRYLFMDLQG